MRRFVLTLSTALMCIGLAPNRADASFWDWVDSLSGPRFRGFNVDWRVWCDSENRLTVRQLQADLAAMQRRIAADTKRPPDQQHPFAGKYYAKAQAAIARAQAAAATARLALTHDDEEAALTQALAFRGHAIRYATLAGDLYAPDPDQTPVAPESETITPQSNRRNFVAGFGGVIVSLCNTDQYERTKRSLSVDLFWGKNAKDHEYDEKVTVADNGLLRRVDIDNKMFGAGLTYAQAPWPWLSFGAGGGVAWFSSNRAPTFEKLYLVPYVIDVKPLAISRNDATSTWWRHLLVVRYGTIIFPTGFEAGRFRRADPRFPAELVHQWGFDADLEPLVRHFNGKW